jgi:hypothetical protein
MSKTIWKYDPLKKRLGLRRWLMVIIFLMALGLRSYNLEISPPGLYVDEASIGYNAYSILKTGKDEHGVSWPLYFKAFGDYKNPVFIYSLAPLLSVKGLKVETVRLGSVVWGSLGVLMMMWLGWEISGNYSFACLNGLILGLMPWHLHYSRLGFEAISLATLMMGSLAGWLRWMKKERLRIGMVVGLLLTLGFFSYSTARLWIPLMMVLMVGVEGKQLKGRVYKLWPLILAGLLIGLGLNGWLSQYPGSLTKRLNEIAIWNDNPGVLVVLHRFWKTFWEHWRLKFLFLGGDPNLRHSSQVSSELLISWGAWLVVGFGVIWKKLKQEKIWRLVLIMIGWFPLAASLTRTEPIATRTLQATGWFSLVISVGIWWSLAKIKQKSKILVRLGMVVIGLMMMFEFGNYYLDLQTKYPGRAWGWFDGGLPEAMEWVADYQEKTDEKIYLSDKIHQAYIQGLFFMKVEPEKWQMKKDIPFKVAGYADKEEVGTWLVTAGECGDGQRKLELINYCVMEGK